MYNKTNDINRQLSMLHASSKRNSKLVHGVAFGKVVATDDPSQMGRIKVYCPDIDDERAPIDQLPWCAYISPFGGVTTDWTVGPDGEKRPGVQAYGFWAIPKIGAMVAVVHIAGDPRMRYYIGCIYEHFMNPSLPAGVNRDGRLLSDDGQAQVHKNRNLGNAGLNSTDKSEARTRGWYERQVADSELNSREANGDEGYGKSAIKNVKTVTKQDATGNISSSSQEAGKALDSQVHCFTTPGGHYLTMSDNDEYCRVRIRTTMGHQIIMDDTNERVYISTAKGNSWIELDEDGHVNVFGSESISFSTGKDFNVTAAGNINLHGKGVNLAASSEVKITSGGNLHLFGTTTSYLSGGTEVHVNGAAHLVLSGAKIDLNGPPAQCAGSAGTPSIVPAHEPWTRPASSSKRNKNWKP